MKRNCMLLAAVASTSLALGAASVYAQATSDNPMSFFVTSEAHSGNLGGLAGADAICQRLAAAVGGGNRTWHAYLSVHATPTQPAVNARDRIGSGPWYNAKGVMIAASVADLHGDIQRDSNLLFQDTALNEKGQLVNGRNRPAGTPNEHDMLTGSDTHGRAFQAGLASQGDDRDCHGWTSDSSDAHAMIGHHDRQSQWNTSWNSSHSTQGCSLADFNETGGAGHFYCFAIN